MSYEGTPTPKELTKRERADVMMNCPVELSLAIGGTFSWLPDAWFDGYEWYVGWFWVHLTLSNPKWFLEKWNGLTTKLKGVRNEKVV